MEGANIPWNNVYPWPSTQQFKQPGRHDCPYCQCVCLTCGRPYTNGITWTTTTGTPLTQQGLEGCGINAQPGPK